MVNLEYLKWQSMMVFPILKGLFRYELMDHYAVLGVPVNAGMDKIRSRYLKIAYRLHPDTCKAKGSLAKQKAGQLFSRVVNPSYEKLSRENSRSEYLIVLAQTSRLVTEADLGSVESKAAKKLLTVNKNVELAYLKLLSLLNKNQYDDLDKIYERIAEISELNLVYLKLKQGEPSQPQKTTVSEAHIQQPSSQTSQPIEVESSRKTTSGLENYLKRAQEALEKEDYDKVMFEVRDALKIDPKNGRGHALMGLAYLRKNQQSMAKVHIGTALKGSPNDPIVRQARSEYNKAAPDNPLGSSGSKKDKEKEEDSKKTGFWNWTKFKK